MQERSRHTGAPEGKPRKEETRGSGSGRDRKRRHVPAAPCTESPQTGVFRGLRAHVTAENVSLADGERAQFPDILEPLGG